MFLCALKPTHFLICSHRLRSYSLSVATQVAGSRHTAFVETFTCDGVLGVLRDLKNLKRDARTSLSDDDSACNGRDV